MSTTEAITTDEGQEAAALLERTRETVNPELRRTVESLPGSMRRVAMYHFGWEHEDGTPAAGNAGKAIRPALVLTAAQALRGTVKPGTPYGRRWPWSWRTTSRCCTTT